MLTVGVLLSLAVFVLAIEDINDTVAPNATFAVIYNFSKTVQSVALGGVSVQKGSQPSPCQSGVSCWQPLSAPELPSGVGLTKELALNASDETEVLILYAENVNKTEIKGDIEYFKDDKIDSTKHVLLVPYRDDELKGKEVYLLTGFMNNTTLEYTFNFTQSGSAAVRIQPAEGNTSLTLFNISFNGAGTPNAWRGLVYVFSIISVKAVL
ncbi:hypothetical protein SprV_0802482700 [Sparganum proliferum]